MRNLGSKIFPNVTKIELYFSLFQTNRGKFRTRSQIESNLSNR